MNPCDNWLCGIVSGLGVYAPDREIYKVCYQDQCTALQLGGDNLDGSWLELIWHRFGTYSPDPDQMPDSSASYYLWAEGQEQRACHSKMAADSGVDSCHDHQPLSGICWDMVFLVFLHLLSVQHDTMGNKGYLGYLFIYSCHVSHLTNRSGAILKVRMKLKYYLYST